MNQMNNLKDKHQSLGKSNIGKIFYLPITIVVAGLTLLFLNVLSLHVVTIMSFIALFITIPLLFIALVKGVKYANQKMDITIKSYYQSIQNDINMEKDTDYIFSNKEEVKQISINEADLFTHRASELHQLALGNERVQLYATAFLIRNGQYSSYAFHGFYVIYKTQHDYGFEIRDKGKSKNYPLLKNLDAYKIFANQHIDINEKMIQWYEKMKNKKENRSVLIAAKPHEFHIAFHRYPYAPPRIKNYQEKDHERVKHYIDEMNDILHTLETILES